MEQPRNETRRRRADTDDGKALRSANQQFRRERPTCTKQKADGKVRTRARTHPSSVLSTRPSPPKRQSALQQGGLQMAGVSRTSGHWLHFHVSAHTHWAESRQCPRLSCPEDTPAVGTGSHAESAEQSQGGSRRGTLPWQQVYRSASCPATFNLECSVINTAPLGKRGDSHHPVQDPAPRHTRANQQLRAIPHQEHMPGAVPSSEQCPRGHQRLLPTSRCLSCVLP